MAAKTVNFGIIYGMGSYGLSTGLNISVEEAQQFIDTFYATYPKIRSFYDQYLADAKKNGFVETLLGHRRYVFEYSGDKFIDNATRRVLINFPIQGSAAEMMKKAMIEIHRVLTEQYPDSHLLLQIHDDLVFEMPDNKDFLPSFISTVRNIMCTIYPLSVPLEVEVKVGKNWGEMEKIPEND
jgi:DNA polymerase-1